MKAYKKNKVNITNDAGLQYFKQSDKQSGSVEEQLFPINNGSDKGEMSLNLSALESYPGTSLSLIPGDKDLQQSKVEEAPIIRLLPTHSLRVLKDQEQFPEAKVIYLDKP